MKFSSKSLLLMLSLVAIGSSRAEEEEDVCVTQTEGLAEDGDLMSAMSDMANATMATIIPPADVGALVADGSVDEDGIEGSCVLSGETELVCKFDYSGQTADLESACTAAGGQFYAGDVRITCQGVSQRAEFNYLAAPICLGVDCEEPGDIFESAMEDLADSEQVPGVVTCAAYFDDVDAPLPTAGAATWMAPLSLFLSAGVAGFVATL